MRAVQGPLRARENRHVRIAQLGCIERIPGGLMHIHISRNHSDGRDLNFRRAQRHDQRHGVVGSGISINQKWTIHATQNNKLASETRHKIISAISASTPLALPASNFARISAPS